MKNICILLLFTAIVLTPSFLFGSQPSIKSPTTDKNLAIFYSINGNIEKKYNTLVEKKLKRIGFNLTDPHKRVNDQYKTKYGSTVLDVLSFMPIVQDSTILPLLNIDPRIAGFSPFNLLIYKKLDENITHVGHLLPQVMLDILGIQNKEVRSKFSSTFKALDATISQELDGEISYLSYNKLPKQTMINYEYTFEVPEDLDDFISEFQNTFELAFIDKGYLIAGFHDFMMATDDAEEILSGYDAFWTYSLCHLEFSYNMFDKKNARPEAGLFAPCTMYMYIRKGTNKVVIGMFRLHNWSETLNIKDTNHLNLVEKLDTEIPTILTSLGMTAIPNINPLLKHNTKLNVTNTVQLQTKVSTKVEHHITQNNKQVKTTTAGDINISPENSSIQRIKVGDKTVDIKIPKVPTVIESNSSRSHNLLNRGIKFSTRVPPNYIPHGFDKRLRKKTSKHTRIGEVNKGKISTYLRTDFLDVNTVKEKLKSAGFKVLSVSPINQKKDLISIVFTNASLIKMASIPKRGFIASLRVLVDKKDKKISITNPLYMAKGFLQEDFNGKEAKKILVQLIAAFPQLKNSKDALKYQLLPQFQLMKGMPKYEDMVEVASGDHLLEQIKDNNRVIFKQTLNNGTTLIGIKLGKRTRRFTKRIGRNNAAMLPYPILIENDKAKILDPKYYISYMYPQLSMSEFMSIATVPGAIVKDCEKIFKKK